MPDRMLFLWLSTVGGPALNKSMITRSTLIGCLQLYGFNAQVLYLMFFIRMFHIYSYGVESIVLV